MTNSGFTLLPSTMSLVDIPKTYGALLIGGLFASLLGGTVTLQTLSYFRTYDTDQRRIKVLVFIIWLLDTGHSGFIWGALWEYLISDYARPDLIDVIPWSLALSIVFTAILTFLVHGFFAHRIFLLSGRNWYLTVPIIILAVLRLAAASVTTVQMIRLESFSGFKKDFSFVFTLGLALSSAVDIYITASLCFLLQMSRGAERLNAVIDSLILYAFETGSLTCAATVVSMICWILISHNLIFMGLHFVIGKLYATSLLVTLNTRRRLRRGGSGSTERYVDGSESVLDLNARRAQRSAAAAASLSSPSTQIKSTELQISVERSIQQTVETFHREHDFYSMASARH